MTLPTEGPDFLIGDDATNVIFGKGGNDLIFGKGGADLLVGEGDDDILVGGRGDDFLNGGDGIDTANYNDASFAISANLVTGIVTVTAGALVETDTLVDIENVTGGAGKDFIIGDSAANKLSGMGGDDTLWSGQGKDTLSGGDGQDWLFGSGGGDVIDGGAGDDDVAVYWNSNSGVTVNLATGTASGGDAQGDTLFGIESLVGSDHNDNLTGTSEDNYLSGDLGNDLLKGGGGDDILVGDEGADDLRGGNGHDTIYYNNSTAGIDVDLLANTISGGLANGDAISGIEGVDASGFADTLLGTDVYNRFYGNDGKDLLSGRGGDDYLDGGKGNDSVNGGTGDDIIVGNEGHDVINGGLGEDYFGYSTLADTGKTAATRDVIEDFETGIDEVAIKNIDANSLLGGDQQFTFIGTQVFGGIAGQLHVRSEGGNTILEGDVNGDKIADFQIEFTGQVTFGSFDLIL